LIQQGESFRAGHPTSPTQSLTMFRLGPEIVNRSSVDK
jgi:hypothetical protein